MTQYTVDEFHNAAKRMLGEPRWGALIANNFGIPELVKEVALAYFDFEIQPHKFEDMDVIRFARRNLRETGMHGLIEEAK